MSTMTERKITFRAFLLTLFAISLMSIPSSLLAIECWFESATLKVRKNTTARIQNSFGIKAARNEFEPFQLILKTGSGESFGAVDIEIGDFTGTAGKISSDNVTIFLVKYLNIVTLSSIEGLTGEWPDILCPKIDAYFHEKRNFFPFNLPPGIVQPVFFDVFIPNETTPGSYAADVKVTNGAETLFTGKINLDVWNFSIPPVSQCQTIFILSGDVTWQGHYGGTWPKSGFTAIKDLHRVYMRAGLRHRFTYTPLPIYFGNWNGSSYDSYIKNYFLDSLHGFIGDGDPGVEYGASQIKCLFFNMSFVVKKYLNCTSVSTTPPSGLLAEVRERLRIIASTVPENLRKITYILPLDEPGGGEVGCGSLNPTLDYNCTKEVAKIIHEFGLKVLVTKRRRLELLNTDVIPPRNDYIDMWVSPFDQIVGRDWTGAYDRRSEYIEDLAKGVGLMWYQGCNTTGCGGTGGSSYNGFPQYNIEYPAIYNRIFPWMTYKYDIPGELYYSTTGAYTSDPWESLYLKPYVVNGEGTFYFPGVPDTIAVGLPYTTRGIHTPSIGGTYHIPVESFRIKMMREGMEDYEYMKILKNLGYDDVAKAEATEAVTSTYDFIKDPSQIYKIRENLANAILSILSSGNPPPLSPQNLTIKK